MAERLRGEISERCGNIKRVASAVGDGSIAISFVHRALAEQVQGAFGHIATVG
jgi:hypothetical protein